jgi:hypothetical protein
MIDMCGKNFKNVTDQWQVWGNVFTEKQVLAFEGSEKECEKFLNDNNPEMNKSNYSDLFMIAPHTGRNEDFSKFDC